MGPNFVLDKGYTTTAAIRKFRCVKLGAADDRVLENSVLGEQSIGVCQDEISASDGTNNRVADIRIMGITRVIVDAAYARQTPVRVAADGRVTALAGVTANQNQIGILLATTTAANDQCDMLLTVGSTRGT